MTYTYKTKGVCSRSIRFDISDDGIVSNVAFEGGCNGNTKGICALIEGMKAEDIINRCEGINCNMKGTSCPDQLATALKQALEEK